MSKSWWQFWKPDHRQVLLINRPFQLRFLAYTSGIALIVGAIFYSAIQYFFWSFHQKGMHLGLAPDHIFFRFLDEQSATMNTIGLIAMISVFCTLIANGLYLSNRIAGPIHNATQFLKMRAKKGTSGKLKFRQADFFHELADAVNECLDEKSQSLDDAS